MRRRVMDLQLLTYGRLPSLEVPSLSLHTVALSIEALNGDPGHDALVVDLDAPGSDRVLRWAESIPPRPVALLFGSASRAFLRPLLAAHPEMEPLDSEDPELLPLLLQRFLERLGRHRDQVTGTVMDNTEADMLLDSLDDVVVAIDRDGRLQWAHHPASNHSILPAGSLHRGTPLDELGFPDPFTGEIRTSLEALMRDGGVRSFEIQVGSTPPRWFGCKVSARHNEDGTFAGITIVGREITELIEARSSLNHLTADLEASFMRAFELAFTDRTTGLPNREAFLQTVELSIEQKSSMSVAIISLHNLANIRHSMPFETGEQIVRTLAGRITAATGRDAVVARYGETEFAFLFHADAHGTLADAVAETHRFVEMIEAPVSTSVASFSFPCSAGIARYPDDASTMEPLVQAAEIALQEARDRNTERVRVFSPAHREELKLRTQMENELARPDITGEMMPVFQPIVEARNMRGKYFEVLLRWNSPRLGALRPDLFIPLAEKNGRIIPITLWLFRETARLLRRVPADVGFSVNLSPVHLFVPGLVETLLQILREENAAPARFKIEITEGVFIRDSVEATKRIIGLKEAGFSVALDDFGAGFSGLGYLGLLPVDNVKIDKSFIDKYPDDHRTEAIVGSVLTLTRSLGIQCIAEGVETEKQADALRAAGCDLFQGYLIARPLAIGDMLHFLDSRPPADP